jgi:hypothetical protein
MLLAFEPVSKPWGMHGIPKDFCFDQLPEDFDHLFSLHQLVNSIDFPECAFWVYSRIIFSF